MATRSPDEVAALVFVDIAVIVVVARLMGGLAVRLRQPVVVGEIIAGLVLGASALGAIAGGRYTDILFPQDVRPFLRLVAQLGLVIFMFIVGLELDVGLIRGNERSATVISTSSVALPFVLGAGLAVWLYNSHGTVNGEKVSLLPFALFIGAAMSVTAFPVLARILTERGLHRTELGALTLAAAAIDDILAWSILAVVLAVLGTSDSNSLPVILAMTATFVAFMFLVVRPRLRLLVTRFESAGRLTPNILAVVLVGLLVSAFITDRIGIHAIFGAFIFGVVMPRQGTTALFHEILEKLEQVSLVLLLPVFFIVTGLNVKIAGLASDRGLLELAAVIAVACVGKFVGAWVAARAVGVRPRKATAIGILMNTRGLTELVILNIGLQRGVIDQRLFTMLVIMAVFTTVITGPLLRRVYPDRILAREIAEAERAALGVIDGYRVVALVREHEPGDPVVDVAAALLGRDQPGEIVLSRFDPPTKRIELGAGLTSELSAMADAFGEMDGLVRRASELGVETRVRSQISSDVARDIVAQAQGAGAGVILMATVASDPEARQIGTVVDKVFAQAECSVVLLVEGPVSQEDGGNAVPTGVGRSELWGRLGAQLWVDPGTGPDGLAAIEHAVRMSERSGRPVIVEPPMDRRSQRRTNDAIRRLSACGVAIVAAEHPRGRNAGGVASRPVSALAVIGLAGISDGRPPSAVASSVGLSAGGRALLVQADRTDATDRFDAFVDRVERHAALPAGAGEDGVQHS